MGSRVKSNGLTGPVKSLKRALNSSPRNVVTSSMNSDNNDKPDADIYQETSNDVCYDVDPDNQRFSERKNKCAKVERTLPEVKDHVSDDCESTIRQEIDIEKPIVDFEGTGLCAELTEQCKALGWVTPSSIQAKVIPLALSNHDVLGLAETGSGKTGAFLLPLLHKLLDSPKKGYGLILTPTRELGIQVARIAMSLGSAMYLELVTLVGGVDMTAQACGLGKRPHVIVATPGRLLDHLENTKGFNLGGIHYFVMDEADRLLGSEFDDSIDRIVLALPKTRTTLLFSATMTENITKLQRLALKDPKHVSVNIKLQTVDNLSQTFKLLAFKHKYTYLLAILRKFVSYQSIIFTNTCLQAHKISLFLTHAGLKATSLHGKLTQPQRLNSLNRFTGETVQVLVTTDVGSRGLDIKGVQMVVNFDVPNSPKDYVHRVGRTARAGKSGQAITLVTQYDVEAYQRIELALAKKLDENAQINEEEVMELHQETLECLRMMNLQVKEMEEAKWDGKKNSNQRRRKHKKY